ncbi:glycosyltransferase family 2 protein, partial [Fulvivirga lutimaris]|uniref:glycosyltransferase family 2 protein n=1 Tax=Fulvivirga lutimaris TaxID=1819566 RepID=UPI0012BB9D0D
MRYPFFSIIIPCYNHGKYLNECIDSILNQRFDNYEVIIVNDGSTDDSLSIAQSLAKNSLKISVIDKTNGGLSSARNAGLASASGQYLQFLDADDLLYPDALDHVNKKIENSDHPELIQTAYAYFKNDKIFHNVIPNTDKHIYPAVLNHNIGPCHSIFINKEAIHSLGSFDENLRSAEDWDMWMRAAKANYRLEVVTDVCVGYRYVADSMSRNAFVMYEALSEVISRAHKLDKRIKVSSKLNKDLENYDMARPMKKLLMTCLGVSVMQGDIDSSIKLYQTENKKYNLSVDPKDFKDMYSYLTFRYWNKKKEIIFILESLRPHYWNFLKGLG